MAFSRKQMVAAVAGTLSLAVLTGCPAATAPTPPTTSATPAATASATPAAGASTPASTAPGASTAPSTDPNASAAPGASTAPAASAPVPSGKVVILSGNVYDEDGATVDDALITVKSLDASVPYTATATSNAGSWVVNNVPEGANVEIIATKDGWTSRRRVGSFQQQATGKRNVINFGAAGGNADSGDDDVTGEAYFISDFPEITMTTPAMDAKGVDATKLSYKLTFSEPLTEDSRDNFDDAFHILPANFEAISEADQAGETETDMDLDRTEDDGPDDGISSTVVADDFDTDFYTLSEGDEFLGSSSNQVTAAWNAEGTEVTYSFDGGLKADDNDAAKYQAIVVLESDSDELEDEDGNQLGTDDGGDLSGYNGGGEVVYNAFKELDLAIADADDADYNGLSTDERNWASTHATVNSFEVAEDDTDPKLTGFKVSEDTGHLKLAMTFSEPMAAFGGNGEGIFSAEILDPTNYTFELGTDSGDITATDLEGGDNAVEVHFATANELEDNLKDAGGAIGTEAEFFFSADEFVTVTDGEDVSTDEFTIEVDENDPQVVLMWLGLAAENHDEIDEMAVRVEGVEDPAGNPIDDNDADDQVQIAKI